MLSMTTSNRYAGTVTAAGTARSYHHGNLRAALLDGAERMLAERGSGQLSLRELAREVGVSHAAPRRHFPDRQALLDALALQGFERLAAELEAAVADRSQPFGARFAALARTYVGFATEHAALLELMFAGKHRPGAETLREAADLAFATPLTFVAEGMAAGELDGSDPERVGTITFAAFHGLATLVNGGMLASEGLEARVGGAVEQLLHGLRPR
jgi:AcrR family transcriptional regulator